MFLNSVLEALFNEDVLIPSKQLKHARAILNGRDAVALIAPDNELSHQIPKEELYRDDYLLSHIGLLDQAKFSCSKNFVTPALAQNSFIEFSDMTVCFKAPQGSDALNGRPVKVLNVYCWNPGVPYIGCDRVFFILHLDGLFVPLRQPTRNIFLTRLRGQIGPQDPQGALPPPEKSKNESADLSNLIGKDKNKLKKINAALGQLLVDFDETSATTSQEVVDRYKELVSRSRAALLDIGVDGLGLLSEHLECHMGFRIYDKLRFFFADSAYLKNLTLLRDLDVSQVGLPEGVNLSKCDRLVNRVVEIFDDIVLSTVVADVCRYLVRAMDSLGEAMLDAPVSADALLGLFLLVVVRAKSSDRLELYLFIIRHFAYFRKSLDRGHLGYVLMTVESVIHHIKKESKDILAQANAASKFWAAIESGSLSEVKSLQDHSVFRARRGTTALFTCVKNDFMDIFDYLLDSGVLSAQDIADDRDGKGRTLLIAALECKSAAVCKIVEIISKLPESQQREYYRQRDSSLRSAGHYLFHRADLIEKLGVFIDWTAKDRQSRTPLLTLAVCYDHPDYDEMIMHALDAITAQNPAASLFTHIERNGTSFLHLVNPQTMQLMKRISRMPGFDINALDHKLRSPLAIALRFNRTKLVQFILAEHVHFYNTDFFTHTSLNSDDVSKRLLEAVRASEACQDLVPPEVIRVYRGSKTRFELTTLNPDGVAIRRNLGDFLCLRAVLEKKYPLSWQPALGMVDTKWVNNSVIGRNYGSSITEILSCYLKSLKSHATISKSPELAAFCSDPDWTGEEAIKSVENETSTRWERANKEQNFDGTEKYQFFEQEARSINTFFQYSIEQMQNLMQLLTRLASSMQHLVNTYWEESIHNEQAWEEICLYGQSLVERARPMVTSSVRDRLQQVYSQPRVVCTSLALNSARIVESLSTPVQMIKEMATTQVELAAQRRRLAELGSRKAWPLAFLEDRRIKDMHETEDRISTLRSKVSRFMSRITHSQEILASELSSFLAFQEGALLDVMRTVALSHMDSLSRRLAKMQYLQECLKAHP